MQITDVGAAGNDLVQGLSAVLFGALLLYNDNSNEDFSQKSLRNILDARIGTDVYQGVLKNLAKADVLITATKVSICIAGFH